MTSSTITPAVSNGGEPARPEHGVAVLRSKESMGLISLVQDALSETYDVGHEMHAAIYGKKPEVTDAQLEQMLCEALTCLETADHYLRMLGGVLDERTSPHGQSPTGVPATVR